MELETLKSLLDIDNREHLFNKILSKLKIFANLNYIEYDEGKTKEGIIPCLKLSRQKKIEGKKYLKIFVGAQHNEYNGLFGIVEFLDDLVKGKIKWEHIGRSDQDIIFFPLMNPYGFLNPSESNKSGYYLKNGTNLNRYWRKTFVPQSPYNEKDANGHPIPDHTKYVKKTLQKYWQKKNIQIYLLDFHETSLLEKYPRDLLDKLKNKSITYKFDHWLKEGIILNIMKLNEIKYFRRPLFRKCNPSADHDHINLSYKQLDIVYEELAKYIDKNHNKLPFYFCYANKSKDYCERLANNVYKKLSDLLWETYYPSFDHSFYDHGCFVLMSEATPRKHIYTMELESKKHFYDIFAEIEKSKKISDYYENQLKDINKGLKLVKESILQMIQQF